MPVTVAAALVLSALSVAVPLAEWASLSVSKVTGLGQNLTPDSVTLVVPVGATSVQVKSTATLLLFHPAVLAAGVRFTVTPGVTRSILTPNEPLPLLPTLSVAVEVLVTTPSPVTASLEGVGGLAPDPPVLSVAAQLTVTLLVAQPAALIALAPVGSAAVPVTVGPALSTVYDACVAPLTSPVSAVQVLFFL